MTQEQIVVDSQMRKAFAIAHNTGPYGKLKRMVAKRLRTNKGRIFSKGWKVIRRKGK